MGQTNSHDVELQDSAAHFDNLEAVHLEALWKAFTEVASGFALNLDEFLRIFSVLAGPLGDTPEEMQEFAYHLFQRFLPSESSIHVVDSMEVFIGLAFIANMTLEDRVNFVFDCFDFDADGKLDIGEVTLSLKSTDAALTKLVKGSGEDPSNVTKTTPEDTIVVLAREWFASCAGSLDDDVFITRDQFVRYCIDPDQSVRAIFEVGTCSIFCLMTRFLTLFASAPYVLMVAAIWQGGGRDIVRDGRGANAGGHGKRRAT
jgi:Ca2+-binding EF-hand superfamily protein